MDDLGTGPIGVDTAAFIYFIEENETFLPIVAPLFRAADDGTCELVASALTLFEVLVVPYRAGNVQLAERYEALLSHSRGIRLADMTRGVLRLGAQLRAATGAATPDALQMAGALAAGCSSFVTNDRRLPAVPGLKVFQLRDYAR